MRVRTRPARGPRLSHGPCPGNGWVPVALLPLVTALLATTLLLAPGTHPPGVRGWSLAQKWSPAFAPSTPRLNISLVLRPDTWTSDRQLEDYIEPEELLNATQIAMTFIVDYWNNQSTYLNNSQALLQLQWITDAGKTGTEITQAVAALHAGSVQGLVQDSVNGSVTEAYVTGARGVPQCSIYSPSTGLADGSLVPTLQRLSSSADNNAYAMVDVAHTFRWTKVALLYESGTHCQAWRTNLRARAQANYPGNFTFPLERSYELGADSTALDGALAAVAASPLRVILACTEAGNKLPLFKRAQAAGLWSRQWVFDDVDSLSRESFGDFAFSYDLLLGSFFIGGSEVRPTTSNELDLLWNRRGNDQNCASAEYACFNADTNDNGYSMPPFLYKWYTRDSRFPYYVYQVYDCLKSLVAGYASFLNRGVGNVSDILAFQVFDRLAPSATISTSSNNASALLNFLNRPPVAGVSIPSLEVDASGLVVQQKRVYCYTSVPLAAQYPTPKVVFTWFANSTLVQADVAAASWGGSTAVPTSVFALGASEPVRVTTAKAYLPQLAAIAINFIAGLAVLGVAGCALFLRLHWSAKHIHRATPLLLGYILAGALLALCSIFVAAADPTPVTCGAEYWLKHLGSILAFGALILKSFRIAVIFNSDASRVVYITNRDLLLRLLALVVLVLMYLVLWFVLSPPPINETLVQTASIPDYDVYAVCRGHEMERYLALAELLLLVYGAYIAYLTRHVPSEYNESRWLGASIYTWLLVTVLLFFVETAVTFERTARFVVISVSILLTTTAMLVFVFGPKIAVTYALPPARDGLSELTEGPSESLSATYFTTGGVGGRSQVDAPSRTGPAAVPSTGAESGDGGSTAVQRTGPLATTTPNGSSNATPGKVSVSVEMHRFLDALTDVAQTRATEEERRRILAELQLLGKELKGLEDKMKDDY